MTDAHPTDLVVCDEPRCAGRPAATALLAEVDGVRLCVDCWKGHRRPWPKRVYSALELEEARRRQEDRMLKRGGTSAHLVKKGLT